MKRWLKVLLAGLVGSFAVVVAVFAFVAVQYWIRGTDIDSPQDEDLLVPRRVVADSSNGFQLLARAGNMLQWPEEVSEGVAYSIDAARGVEALDQLVARNQAALGYADQAISRGDLQVPLTESGELERYDVRDWMRIGELWVARSRVARQRGDAEGAERASFKALQLGHLAQASGGGLTSYFAGGAIQNRGLTAVRELARAKLLSEDEARNLRARVHGFRPDASDFVAAQRAEYLFWAEALEDPAIVDAEVDFLTRRYHFQLNATKKLFAESYRAIGELFDEPCTAVPANAEPLVDRRDMDSQLQPNSSGKIIFDNGRLAREKILVSKCYLNTNFAATELMLAFRAFEARSSASVENLAVLVPAYIPAIPLDDFDGEPIRLSVDGRFLYSVGEDRADDAGHEENDLRFGLQP